MAYLIFSNQKKYDSLNGGAMLSEGSTVPISYYDGKEISEQLESEDELNEFMKEFSDCQIVFQGEIDESKITTETKDHYDEFCDARYWKEFDEQQEKKLDELAQQDISEMISEEIFKSIDEEIKKH